MANDVRSAAVTVVVGFLVLLMVGVGLFIGVGQVEGRSTVGGRQVIDLTTLAAGDGFIIQGDTADDNAGSSVSTDRKSTRLNSSHMPVSRMPSSA